VRPRKVACFDGGTVTFMILIVVEKGVLCLLRQSNMTKVDLLALILNFMDFCHFTIMLHAV
jgi:hypothetical protein